MTNVGILTIAEIVEQYSNQMHRTSCTKRGCTEPVIGYFALDNPKRWVFRHNYFCKEHREIILELVQNKKQFFEENFDRVVRLRSKLGRSLSTSKENSIDKPE